MSIDEAITHCLEVADGQTAQGRCPECAEDHRQLAKWLNQLKQIKGIVSRHDTDSMPEDYWYIDKIREVVQEVEE